MGRGSALQGQSDLEKFLVGVLKSVHLNGHKALCISLLLVNLLETLVSSLDCITL